MVGSLLRADRRRRLRGLRARAAPHERDGLRRPARCASSTSSSCSPRSAPATPPVPPRARRRVPGHQPRPVPAAAAAGRRAPQPGRRGRRRAVASTASAAPTSATSSTSRTTSRTREVVTLEQNYRSTQTILDAANGADRPQPRPDDQDLWTDLGEGDPVEVRELDDEHAEARFVVGEIERLVDEGVSRAEIAVFYRTNAQSRVLEDTLVRREIAYQVIGGTKFYERAEIKDAIAYLQVLANGAGRRLLHARGQLAAARHRPDVALARARARGDDGHLGLGRGAPTRRRCPGLGTAAVRAFERFMDDDGRRCARRPTRSVPVGDLLEAILHETGYLDGAGGRAHDRGPGPHREPRGARRGRARVRRAAEERRRPGPVPPAGLAGGRRRHAPGRRGPRDAHDAAQRQGARVPDRLHHRLRGGRSSRTRARSTRARSRRSGAWPTSASRARCATST